MKISFCVAFHPLTYTVPGSGDVDACIAEQKEETGVESRFTERLSIKKEFEDAESLFGCACTSIK